MEITRYKVELDNDRKNILVKESTDNYLKTDMLNSPEKIADMFNNVFHANRLSEEYAWVVAMNTKCKVLGIFEVSHGGIKEAILSPREIFVRLLLCNAACFTLVHNHPGGSCSASKEDKMITEKIMKASKLMDIEFLDHIIIGDSYYSFLQNELM